jgi:hypothetical protein
MTKKQKPRRFSKKSLAVYTGVVVVLAAVVVLCLVVATYVTRYNQASDAASSVAIRELVLRAAEGTKSPAAIEPTTGNIYFPQARLYLPSLQNNTTQLTYMYTPPAKDQQEELSISSKNAFSRNAARLYAGRNVKEVFEAIPKMQACQRGIALYYSKPTDHNDDQVLKQSISLNNGKTLYMYTQKSCDDLDDIALLLGSIKAY